MAERILKSRRELPNLDSSSSKGNVGKVSLDPRIPGPAYNRDPDSRNLAKLRSTASVSKFGSRASFQAMTANGESQLTEAVPIVQHKIVPGLSTTSNTTDDQSRGRKLPQRSIKTPPCHRSKLGMESGQRKNTESSINVLDQKIPLPPILQDPESNGTRDDGNNSTSHRSETHLQLLQNTSRYMDRKKRAKHSRYPSNSPLRATKSDVIVPGGMVARRRRACGKSNLENSFSVQDISRGQSLGQVEDAENPCTVPTHTKSHKRPRKKSGVRCEKNRSQMRTESNQELQLLDSATTSNGGPSVEQRNTISERKLHYVRQRYDYVFENVCMELAKILDYSGQSFFGSCRRSCCQCYKTANHSLDNPLNKATNNEKYLSEIICNNLAIKLQAQSSQELQSTSTVPVVDEHLANSLANCNFDYLVATVCSDLAVQLSIRSNADAAGTRRQPPQRISTPITSRSMANAESKPFLKDLKPLPEIRVDSSSKQDVVRTPSRMKQDNVRLAVPPSEHQHPPHMSPLIGGNKGAKMNGGENGDKNGGERGVQAAPREELASSADTDTEFSSESLEKYLTQPRPQGHHIVSGSEAKIQSALTGSNDISRVSTTSLHS